MCHTPLLQSIGISIHALREEGDLSPTAVGYRLKSIISIHALREEGDAIGVETHRQVTEFLSTPSARRATASVRGFEPSLYNFYPRPPRGGRPAPWNCTTEIA